MLALHLTVQVFAASEVLHHCLHEDAHAADHHCVIQLVADGQFLAGPTPDRLTAARPCFVPPLPPADILPVVNASLLPPGRAPPSLPA